MPDTKLLAARLTRLHASAPAGATIAAGSDELARVYHLGKTQFVHDKRTGTCDGQPKRVLGGGIDRFLPAHLLTQSQVPAAKARHNGHAD